MPCSIAADLIAAARREMPIIDLALNAVEQGFGMPTLETSIGPDGATTNLICFDDGGDHEALLLKRTGRQLDSADNKGRNRTASSSRPFVRAHRWQRMLDEGRFASVRELGDAVGVAHSYVCRVLRLTLLASDIVERILDGRPTAAMPHFLKPFPVEWERQRQDLL